MKMILSIMSWMLFVTTYAAEMPKSFQVKNGNVKIELSEHSFWNLDGIWLGERQVGRVNGGAWYGTVTKFSSQGGSEPDIWKMVLAKRMSS